MSAECACSVFEIIDFQYLNHAHSCYFQLTWWMCKLKVHQNMDRCHNAFKRESLGNFWCNKWSNLLQMLHLGLPSYCGWSYPKQNNLRQGWAFCVSGETWNAIRILNKPKAFAVLVERAGLDSNSIRCNMQQNLSLLWDTCTNLIWECLACEGNLNPAYWLAPLPLQSSCCMHSLSLKGKMVTAGLRTRQRLSREKAELWHWGSN